MLYNKISEEFVKRANVHQLHFCDLVLLGKGGLEELNDKIEKFLSTKSGKDVGLNTTVKIDGSPALFCYSKFPGYPDNSICLKSFVANANNVLSSEEEIEERYGDRAEMAEKLKFGLELAKYIPEGECWQGDCLFTQRDLKEQEIDGTKYLTFQPNKIVYAFSEENEGYEKVRDAAFGIAFHTIYKAGKDGGKTQSFRVDPERLKGIPDYFYIMSPAINSAKSNSNFDIKAINDKYDALKKAEQALTSDELYEDLVHNDAFMDYWNTFENANLADKKATNIDEEKFFDELGDYILEKQTKEFQKKYQNLKTAKGKSGAIDKWVESVAELKDILMKHRKTLENMVRALNLAADIKMLLWAGFKDTHTDYSTFYKSRTKGFFKADMEGIAMSDADGNIVKIVDRSAFSSYNRDPDIMAGWEHPGNPVKESAQRVSQNLHTIFETKSFKKLDEEKLWNVFSELLEDDESQKSVVIGWGRMNPPTIGHLKLINKMKDLAMNTQCPARLFLSHTVDKKNERKNPLPYESKIKYATIAFGDLVDVVNTDSKTIMAVLHDLYTEGFTRVIYVGGEDRIGGDGDITELISKYNGYPAKENMYYKFDSIVFESAGHRDENSEDKAEKASASYVRQLVIDRNWEEFKEMVPFTTDKARQLFDELTIDMKVEPTTEKISNPRAKAKLAEEKLEEATFDGADFEKHSYLADVIKNFRGNGVVTKDGKVFKTPERYIGKEDEWEKELLGVKDIPLGGGNSKYAPRRDKFKELTDVDWYDIDKSNYSGVDSKGSRSIKSFNVTAMQEAIQALILTGKLIPEEITLENLQNLLQLPSSTKEEDFNIFMDAWRGAFDNTYKGVATFQKTLTDLGFDDISNLIVLHNYVKNDYTSLSETIFNDYGAATIDKADFYLWNGVGDENFLPDLIEKRKNNEGFVDTMVDLAASGILIGVSLKKVEGVLHAEWDPVVPDDYITGEVTWNIAVNKKDAGTVTNYLNFKTKDGYLVLCVRPNGEGSARTEFRFGPKPNSLSGIAYGSATKPITSLFGDTFSTLMNSKTSATPCQDASEYLLIKLGVRYPAENSTMAMSKEGIVAISNLFAEAAGYGAKNEDGSRKTAPYIKVY